MIQKQGMALLFLLTIATLVMAQSPYELNWKKELPYLATGLGTFGAGYFIKTQIPAFTATDLETLTPTNVNKFDRIATKHYSTSVGSNSNVILIGSFATPALFLLNKKSRSSFGSIAAMYGEAGSITIGLTFLTKSIIRRTRPFVYNSEVAQSLKLKPNARISFFSGHTSMTAVNTFFAAKVFSDLYPNSQWKPLVWGVAALIPAGMGFMRVAAGKHFPTDVITGYVIGAGIGILVPHLHRNRKGEKRNLQLSLGYNNIGLTWRLP